MNGGKVGDAVLSPEFRRPAAAASAAPRVGVLALQGDFREHRAMLEGLGAATSEISEKVRLAASGTRQVSETIGTLSEDVQATDQASGRMMAGAAALRNESGRLRDATGRFLRQVRAG